MLVTTWEIEYIGDKFEMLMTDLIQNNDVTNIIVALYQWTLLYIIKPQHITAFENRIWRPFYFRFLAYALNNVNMSILAHLTTLCLKPSNY